jgi:hypothetical protein
MTLCQTRRQPKKIEKAKPLSKIVLQDILSAKTAVSSQNDLWYFICIAALD